MLCKQAVCPPLCPHFEGKRGAQPVIHCVTCGDVLARDRSHFTKNGFPYCESCLRSLDLESVVRICEISLEKALKALGFTYGLIGLGGEE